MLQLMYSLFTVPSASSVVASSSDYAGGLTTEFLPLLYVVVGAFAAGMFVNFLIRILLKSIGKVAGGRRGRRRGRR